MHEVKGTGRLLYPIIQVRLLYPHSKLPFSISGDNVMDYCKPRLNSSLLVYTVVHAAVIH